MSIDLTKDTIDLSKTYRTRGGSPVTLLHRRPEGWPSDYVYMGLADGASRVWLANGQMIKERECSGDLVEVRVPMEVRLVRPAANNGKYLPDYIDWAASEQLATNPNFLVGNNWKARRFIEILD